ncbi:signal peptidase II [Actinomyces ruminis]|uniref:signal peptidase II n=1 Tax=Actinomyces ruminis TaxID=1937003 RepID=UPI003B84588D
MDQLTKAWAVAALSDGRRVHLLGDWLTLVLLRNPGAAFSFATGQTWIFALIAIAVTVVVIRVSRRLGSMWWAVALGLVLGGAVGNLIDRLVRAPGVLRGHVVDFIDYGGWFVGNVADIAIVGAAVIIMVLSLRGRELDGSRAGAGRGRHAETDA